jgi:hypothetical protein
MFCGCRRVSKASLIPDFPTKNKKAPLFTVQSPDWKNIGFLIKTRVFLADFGQKTVLRHPKRVSHDTRAARSQKPKK